MREHMRACPRCARHDAVVRRSLLIARNLPDIQPSPDFMARLEARLLAGDQPLEPVRAFPVTAWAAIAATLAFVTLVALEVWRPGQAPVRLAPVVASAPESDASVISAAVVASLPTGMSVWPAIVAATHAPVHFVATEMANER